MGWLLRQVYCGFEMSDVPDKLDYKRADVVLCQWRLVIWLLGIVLAITGLGYLLLGSSTSFAQYPGSAGNFALT